MFDKSNIISYYIVGDGYMISYKKLQKLLIDKDIKKTELRDMIKISSSTLARLNTN